jgi:hypothetical protein
MKDDAMIYEILDICRSYLTPTSVITFDDSKSELIMNTTAEAHRATL